MIPWWLCLILWIALPASERIDRTRYWLLVAGQAFAAVGLVTLVGVTQTFATQGAAYALAFGALALVARPYYIRRDAGVSMSHSASLVGRELVTEGRIEPGEAGTALLSGRTFDVRNVGTTPLEAADVCCVREVDGFVLLTSKQDPPT